MPSSFNSASSDLVRTAVMMTLSQLIGTKASHETHMQ